MAENQSVDMTSVLTSGLAAAANVAIAYAPKNSLAQPGAPEGGSSTAGQSSSDGTEGGFPTTYIILGGVALVALVVVVILVRK